MKFTLDCRALAELLSRSQDGELPLPTRSRMRLHLVTCRACRNLDDQLRFLRSVLKELSAQARSDRRPDNERLH
jgi:predicted anti-sigma-YlaC factor YlaD